MPSSRETSQPRNQIHISYISLYWQADSLPLVPPGAFLAARTVRIHLQYRRPKVGPWMGKITPEFLPGESHGQRSLVGYSPRGRKEFDRLVASSKVYDDSSEDFSMSYSSGEDTY